MKYGYGAHLKMPLYPLIILVIIILLLLSRVLASNQTSQPIKRNKVSVPEAHKQQIARRIASGYCLEPFQPSLEMKENADFLLTPAILVQEALSDDIVITYPTE